MKFNCKKQDILDEITNATDFTQQRNSLSILSNIYLEVHGNTLIIKATDNMMGFSTQIGVEAVEEGSTTVFGGKLLEILRLLPDCNIDFETKDKSMNITPESSDVKFKSSLKVIDSTEFPTLPTPEDTPFFTIGQKPFLGMVDQTNFAVSTDETRMYLCGIHLEKNPTGLTMVATDGRRLSISERKFDEPIPDFPKVTIPVKFFNTLKKLSTGEGTFDLCIKNNIIFAQIGKRFFYSSLVKGDFPDYRRVIPQEQTYQCTIKTQEMIDAIKRVSVSIESKVCKLYMDLSANTILLYSEENELGTATEKINCAYEGIDCSICLNYQYLLSPLKVMESPDFTMKFTDPARAIMIFPDGEFDYYHLIMPMQSN